MPRLTSPPRRIALFLFASALTAVSQPATAADWIHWRGPEQNGLSREKGLPDSFDPKAKAKGNVVWTAPFGGRSAPLVMAGQIYILQGFGDGFEESERVIAFDEKTGKKLWEHHASIFHSDIVSSRLGWTSLTADPANKYVYAHTTAGTLLCLDAGGKLVWKRELTEEFGRVSGYGGRIVSPIFDSGLVIVGMLNSSWGDQARGGNRFIAFDGKTGQVAWIHDTGLAVRSTYQSNPVVAVINGQRVLISGGGDGAMHAINVRTGQKVWSVPMATGAINASPVVDGNLIFCSHGEESPGGGPIGRAFCLDAGQIDPKTNAPKVVWDFRRGNRFGLSSPALADGRFYAPDDTGELFCFQAKTGKLLWRYRYGTEVRGAPLVADGKLYIFDVKGRLVIMQLKGDQKPDEDETFVYTFKDPKGLQTETNGTPIAVNGRVYFTTRTDLYCLGDPAAKVEEVKYPAEPAESEFKPNAIAGARLFPAEVTAKPGETVKFTVVLVDANGREVKSNLPDPAAEWSLPLPAKTPAGAQPPALQGKVEGNTAGGTLTLTPVPSQQGYVEAKVAGQTARARVRVAPQLPIKLDFEKAPDGSSPGGWVNTNGKFNVQKLPDGNLVLAKVNTDARPPIAKANAYLTTPEVGNYTIQADILGTLVRRVQPDAGVINSRYSFILDGKVDPDSKKRQVRLGSWEARPRVDIRADFDWQPDTWYTLKLTVEPKEKTALVRAKVWKKGDAEPEKWTIEFDDPNPTRHGAAGLYGYVANVSEAPNGAPLPGSDIFFDNISITPNSKK